MTRWPRVGSARYRFLGILFGRNTFFFFQTAAISRVITVIPARAVIEREQKRRLIALGRNHPGGEAPLFFESHL